MKSIANFRLKTQADYYRERVCQTKKVNSRGPGADYLWYAANCQDYK